MVDSPGRITLWGIEVFMATADERSISAAAKRLGVAPPTVDAGGVNKEVSNQAVKRLLNYSFQHPDPLHDMRGV